MSKRDPRVDAYIAKSPDFAKPILTRLRDTVHATCPDVEEEMKWRHPSFIYKGILCGMATFKQHAAFGFWKGSLVVDVAAKDMDAAGWFGRLTKPSDLAGALKKNKKAQAVFEAFSPSRRRDYVVWITEAKSDETRTRRLAQAIEWIAEGKSRNWKYERR